MTGNKRRPMRNRKSIRMKGWDYRNEGAYFVTICACQMACIFGRVENSRMILNSWGQIVVKTWLEVPDHFDDVILDEFICMPNHLHMIIWIQYAESLGKRHAFSLHPHTTPQSEIGVASGSLGAIIGSFKSAVTKEINLLRNEKQPPIWQPRFHDRIIRNERELSAIRQYIRNNPKNWKEDRDWSDDIHV